VFRLDDRFGTLYAVQSLTGVAYLPAYVVACLAAVWRKRLLGVVAVGLVACHLAWIWGDLPWMRSPTPRATGPRFAMATVNALAWNENHAAVAAFVGRLDADVIVVQELSPELQAALRAPAFANRYPHRVEDPRSDALGSGLYSRFPLEAPEVLAFAGAPAATAVMDVDGVRVRVVAVHTVQPLAGLDLLYNGLGELTEFARRQQQSAPLVLAGDYNATWQHRPFRALVKDAHLTDAHRASGRGLARTWPRGAPFPPFALLDHVLVSRNIEVRSTREFNVPGSDHRGVLVELTLPG
jgi:endonuclease/exonuclease/phosphatase (EEP) superfamily protein YafD